MNNLICEYLLVNYDILSKYRPIVTMYTVHNNQ